MPIGLLTDIAQSFAMTPAEAGVMITVYAWMVGLLSLPLMLLSCRMDLRLLLLTLALVTIGQVGAGLAASFSMLFAARVAGAGGHGDFFGYFQCWHRRRNVPRRAGDCRGCTGCCQVQGVKQGAGAALIQQATARWQKYEMPIGAADGFVFAADCLLVRLFWQEGGA